MIEVLTVEADDEGRKEQHRGDHRQALGDFVLVVRDLGLLVVPRACQEVAREVQSVDRAQQLVVDVGEVELDLARKNLAVFPLDAPVDHPPDGIACWTNSAADAEEVVAELGDTHPDLARGPLFDPVLELVDLVVEGVHEVEEVLGDQVDQAIDHQAGPPIVRAADGLLSRGRVERIAALGRLANGHQPIPRRDQIELLVVDAILLANGDRHEKDAEHVGVLALEPRPGLVVQERRPHQLRHRTLVDLFPEGVAELVLGGIEQVDPLGHRPSVALLSAVATRSARPRGPSPRGPRGRRASARRRARTSRQCRLP